MNGSTFYEFTNFDKYIQLAKPSYNIFKNNICRSFSGNICMQTPSVNDISSPEFSSSKYDTFQDILATLSFRSILIYE
jgi:hypothetical protein